MAYSVSFFSGLAYLNFNFLAQVPILNSMNYIKLMRFWILVVVMAVPMPALADELKRLETGFGLVLHLPEAWQLLSKEDLSAVEGKNDDKLDLPPLMKQRLAERVRQGNLELLFNTRDSHNGVYDNLSLFETNDQVPEAASQIKATCGALPSLLGQTLGKEVRLERCEGKEVQGYPAFIIAYAGSVPSTHVLQYMLQVEQRKSLVLTLTYHEDDAMGSLQDFEESLKRLEMQL